MKKRGFTLIEVLIVIAISVMLTAITITYNGVARDQTALSVEKTKISQFVLQARSLSIATYGNASGTACGYGVSFDSVQKTYSIFAYVPNATEGASCPAESTITSMPTSSTEAEYTNEAWKVHPQNGITFSTAGPNALSLALFYPPNPDTFLFNSSGARLAQATINLVSADGSSTISVNSAGQVSF